MAAWGVFDRWFDSYRWWLCALSGLLLVAAFPPFSSPTCGWIAIVPAWWVISRSEHAQRNPMRYGYLIGLIYFGGVFWWISNVTAIGTFFLVLYLALYPAMWFLLVARLILRGGKKPILLQALRAAALWIMLEWWRSWFLTGFNWNELGVSQAPSIIYRQLAAYGGVHLISFVLVVVNILWAEGLLDIAKTLQERKVVRASFPFAAALIIVAATFALGWHHLQRHRGEALSPPLRFACIQPNILQIPYNGGKWSDFLSKELAALDKTQKLTTQAITGPAKPQLLIWPEATIDEGVFNDRPMNQAVHDICMSFDGWFLLGSQDFDIGGGHKLYNVAYLFGPNGDNYQEYRKTRLVIVGEFMPFRGVLTWLFDTFPSLRKWIPIGMDFTPGPRPEKFVMKDPNVTLAPLICFEDTLAVVADKAARLKPDFFVTITNDGWYWGWCAAWGVRQHLNNAVFRCVEHDRPMIRCANNGISCLIDQDGQVVARLRDETGKEIDIGGIFSGSLQFAPARPTVYESLGDWIVLLSALISVILGIRLFCRMPRSP